MDKKLTKFFLAIVGLFVICGEKINLDKPNLPNQQTKSQQDFYYKLYNDLPAQLRLSNYERNKRQKENKDYDGLTDYIKVYQSLRISDTSSTISFHLI
jgi:hypothetical protein